ncbi:MAG: hypothetical protein HYU37_14615 [Acidobacteria bacterium]|nr:hypothetical protein [Acidobacteriota bacterium]
MNTSPLENFTTAETVLLALREQFAEADPTWCCDAEMVSTLVQGLELTTLLMRDAGRRLQGCPPAALEAAVQSFLEQVDRLSRRPMYPLISASHLSH